MKRVRKAVFPVAGLGTRFLPATKSMPKELLPVVDKPLIQYAVDEARAVGIEQFVFVSSRGKTAMEDHFDRAIELEQTLEARGKATERSSSTTLWFVQGKWCSYASNSHSASAMQFGARGMWLAMNHSPYCWPTILCWAALVWRANRRQCQGRAQSHHCHRRRAT